MVRDWTLPTRINIFLTMVFTRDGLGNFITPRKALWYASHPEWWGIKVEQK